MGLFDRVLSGARSLVSSASRSNLLSTVSRTALAVAMPGAAVLTTHHGRVFADGVATGASRGIGSIADGVTSVFNRVAGRPASTGPSFADRMENGYRDGLQAVTGSRGPTIRKGTSDEFIHGAGNFVGDVATYFIPVPGGAALKGALRLTTLEARGGAALARGLSHVPGASTRFGNAATNFLGHGLARAPGDMLLSARSLTEVGAFATGAQIPAGEAPEGSRRTPRNAPAIRNIPGAGRLIPAAHFNGAATEQPAIAAANNFDSTQVREMQTQLGFQGDDVDGIMGRETAGRIDASIRQNVNPANITAEQRIAIVANMKELAEDLRQNPADPNSRDPRVMQFQIGAYTLGLYGHDDGVKIDGFKGKYTDAALNRLAEISPEAAALRVAQNQPALQMGA